MVNTLILRKASTGDRSSEPPSGGIIPRNRFRYGSASVDTGPMINPGGFGNQVRSTRTTRTRLYKLLKYKQQARTFGKSKKCNPISQLVKVFISVFEKKRKFRVGNGLGSEKRRKREKEVELT